MTASVQYTSTDLIHTANYISFVIKSHLLLVSSYYSVIAFAHLTRLKRLLHDDSHSRYDRNMAVAIRDAASSSIGSVLPTKSLELTHTVHLIEVLTNEIDEIEAAINAIMIQSIPFTMTSTYE